LQYKPCRTAVKGQCNPTRTESRNIIGKTEERGKDSLEITAWGRTLGTGNWDNSLNRTIKIGQPVQDTVEAQNGQNVIRWRDHDSKDKTARTR
jgi:hypothetical protein